MTLELIRLLKDRRLWTGSGPWTVMLLVTANFLVAGWQNELTRERQANLLLNEPAGDSHPGSQAARWDTSAGERLNDFWPLIPDATRAPLVIVSGMSQMYVINEKHDGDEIVSELLDDALAPDGVRTFGLAAPNMCNEEAAMQIIALSTRTQTKPRTFIYAVCFDKFRNIDLRKGYQLLMRSHPEILDAWSAAADHYRESFPLATEKMRQSSVEIRAVPIAQSKTVESEIRAQLARYLPLVAAREDLNVRAQLALFLARNAVLRIKPTSKRPIIQSRYELNKQFMGLIADVARENNIQLILYVIPLNPQAENPYVPREYADFKEWVTEFARSRNIPFANFEDIVPSTDWGEFLGGPDFKHFREPGHRRTAAAILDRFGPLLMAKNHASRPGLTAQ